MRILGVLGVAVFLVPFALGDERPDAVPVNPFAEAAVGDWEVLATAGEKPRFEEWTVTKVDDEKVTVRIVTTGGEKATEHTFSRKEAPTIGELFSGTTFSGPIEAVKSGRATLPIAGDEFRCEKVRFRAATGDGKADGVLYVSAKVKGAGIVQRSLEPGEKLSLVGHGSKEKTVWGKTRKEAEEAK